MFFSSNCFLIICWFWSQPTVLWGYSWICAQSVAPSDAQNTMQFQGPISPAGKACGQTIEFSFSLPNSFLNSR